MADDKLTVSQAVKKHANLNKLWRILEAVNQRTSTVTPIDNTLANTLRYAWAVNTPTGDVLTSEGSEIEQGRLGWLQYSCDLIESMYAQGRDVNGYENLLFPATDYDVATGQHLTEKHPTVTTSGVSTQEYVNYPGGPQLQIAGEYPTEEESARLYGPLVYSFTEEFYAKYFPESMAVSEVKQHTNGKLGLVYTWARSDWPGASGTQEVLVGWYSSRINYNPMHVRIADPWRIVFVYRSFVSRSTDNNRIQGLGGTGTDVLRSRARFLQRLYNWVKENDRTDFTFQVSADSNYAVTSLEFREDGHSILATVRYWSEGSNAFLTYTTDTAAIHVVIKFDASEAASLFSVSTEKTLMRTPPALPPLVTSKYGRTVYTPNERRPLRTTQPQGSYLYDHYLGRDTNVLRGDDYYEYASPLSGGQLTLGTATRGQLSVSAYVDFMAEYKYLKNIAEGKKAIDGFDAYDHLAGLLAQSLASVASNYVCIVVNGMMEYHDMPTSFKNKGFSQDSLVFKHGLTDIYSGEVVKCIAISQAFNIVESNGLRTTAPCMALGKVRPFVVVHPLNLCQPSQYHTNTWYEAGFSVSHGINAVGYPASVPTTILYRSRFGYLSMPDLMSGVSNNDSPMWRAQISGFIASETRQVSYGFGGGSFTVNTDYYPTYEFVTGHTTATQLVERGGPNVLAEVRSARAATVPIKGAELIGTYPTEYHPQQRSSIADGSVDYGVDASQLGSGGTVTALPHWGTAPNTGEFVVGVSSYFAVFTGLNYLDQQRMTGHTDTPNTLSVGFSSDQAAGAPLNVHGYVTYLGTYKSANVLRSADGPITAVPTVIGLPSMGSIADATYGFSYSLFPLVASEQAEIVTGAANPHLYTCLKNTYFQDMPFKGPLRRFVGLAMPALIRGFSHSQYFPDSAGFIGFVGNTYRILHTGGKLAAYTRSNTCQGTTTFIGGKLLFTPTGAGWEVFTVVDELNGVPYTMYLLVYDHTSNLCLAYVDRRTLAQRNSEPIPHPTRSLASFMGYSREESLQFGEPGTPGSGTGAVVLPWLATTALAVRGTYRSRAVEDGINSAHYDAPPFGFGDGTTAITYEYGDPKVAGIWSWVHGNRVGSHPQSGCRALAVRFTSVLVALDAVQNSRGVMSMGISEHSEKTVFDFEKWDFFFLVGERFCDELTAYAHEPAQMTSSRVYVDFNVYTGHIYDPAYLKFAEDAAIARAPGAGSRPSLQVVWVNKLTGVMLPIDVYVPPAYFINRRTALANR